MSDELSATESLALALRSVTPGVSVRWDFYPAHPIWKRTRGAETISAEPRFTGRFSSSRDPSRGREVARSPTTPLPQPLFWKTSIALETSPGFGLPRERAIPAVEAALRSAQGNGVRFSRNRLPWPAHFPWFPISTDELVGVLPGLRSPTGGDGASDFALLPILPLGRSTSGRVIGPPVEAHQGRHLAVLGETGMGKSSTLVSIARKAAALGGVILFDPLGETAQWFLSGLSPRERSRALAISPWERLSGINALEGIRRGAGDPVLSDRRLNDLVHALRRVRSGRYVDASYWGPRLEEMLTRAVQAAAGFPGGNLADAHTLLATGGRIRQVVPPSAQEDVRELVERIRDRPDDAEGARRLLYEVVRSPVLTRMLCERTPSLHPRDLVLPGRIAVISGDASTVGESVARYLLAIYLALVWSELLARPTHSKTFVILDESQWFSHESLAEMLRLARRRNVHVVLATQSVGSLPEGVADAVWTNVADFVAFRGSPEEAQELARATRGVSVEEILALPRGHAAVLLGKGQTVTWLRTAGRAPGSDSPSEGRAEGPAGPSPEPPGPESPFSDSRPAAEAVLEWIRARLGARPSDEPIRVELEELRRRVDPEGSAVRAAGSVLGRAGAIIAIERSPGGSVWILDSRKIPAPAEAAVPSLPSKDTEAPHPS